MGLYSALLHSHAKMGLLQKQGAMKRLASFLRTVKGKGTCIPILVLYNFIEVQHYCTSTLVTQNRDSSGTILFAECFCTVRCMCFSTLLYCTLYASPLCLPEWMSPSERIGVSGLGPTGWRRPCACMLLYASVQYALCFSFMLPVSLFCLPGWMILFQRGLEAPGWAPRDGKARL